MYPSPTNRSLSDSFFSANRTTISSAGSNVFLSRVTVKHKPSFFAWPGFGFSSGTQPAAAATSPTATIGLNIFAPPFALAHRPDATMASTCIRVNGRVAEFLRIQFRASFRQRLGVADAVAEAVREPLM